MARASSQAAFRQYVEETGDLPESVVLGHICYFTISEDQDYPVSHKDLEDAFADLGLNPEFMPAPNRPVDAFKKATKDAEARGGSRGGEHLVLPDGRRLNLLVRDVSTNRERIVRHLVRELVDSKGARLDYDTVGEATFYHADIDTTTGKRKPTGHRLRITLHRDRLDGSKARAAADRARIDAERKQDQLEKSRKLVEARRAAVAADPSKQAQLDAALEANGRFETEALTAVDDATAKEARAVEAEAQAAAELPRLEKVQAAILAQYQHDCTYIDGMKLRAMIRDYVLFLNATQLKPGVYFVHKSRNDELRRLEQLCDRLKNGSDMHLLPMVDLPAQREEVIRKFQVETEQRVKALVEDIASAMGSQTRVTTDTVDRFRVRYRALVDKSTEYTRTLGLAQEELALHLERAMTRLIDLQEKLIEDEAAKVAAGTGA